MNKKFGFKLLGTDKKCSARVGKVTTAHGKFETPVFMAVGTQGSVKALTPPDVKEAGAEIILSNAYHLYIRPGLEIIKKMKGLHRFMGWDGPILTDSGGYQVFSLSKLRNITEDGVTTAIAISVQGPELQGTAVSIENLPRPDCRK